MESGIPSDLSSVNTMRFLGAPERRWGEGVSARRRGERTRWICVRKFYSKRGFRILAVDYPARYALSMVLNSFP
jgi:hypothetical protein